MSRTKVCGRLSAAALISILAVAAPAAAHSRTAAGGASFAPPDISAVRCAVGSATSCAVGAQVRVSGENLKGTRALVFLGGRGAADDRRVRPLKASPHRVVATVPTTARSGRVRVIAPVGTAIGPRVRLGARPAAPDGLQPMSAIQPQTAGAGVFPIRGKHDYGTAINGFGGGRGHQGQDVFSSCGTPIVAALAGEVTLARYQDRAGNYAVIKAADGTSQVYMHMLRPAEVAKGDAVAAGQQIGQVGETGRATGCHLHFELWTAPGWYDGGQAIDPLPSLKRWDSARR